MSPPHGQLRLTDQRSCPIPPAPNWPRCAWWTVRTLDEDGSIRDIGFVLGAGPTACKQTLEQCKQRGADLRQRNWKGELVE